MNPWLQRWQQLNRPQRLALIGLGSLLTVWLLDLLALRSLRREFSHLRQQVRQTETRLLEAVTTSAQAEVVNRAFEDYRPYLKSAGSAELEVAAVLTEVENSVREAGVTLLNLKPVLGTEATPHVARVNVEGEATPLQLMQLLDRLQRSTYLLKVTELSIRVTEGGVLRNSLVVSKLLLPQGS